MGMILSVSKNKIFEIGDIDQKIEQAKIIMNENVFNNIDPEELAMRLNISYSWFRKVFRDYTGYAPAKYFQELKLRKAKQLLLSTSQSVKEISFMLAYKSTEHFLPHLRSVPVSLHWNIVLLAGRLMRRMNIDSVGIKKRQVVLCNLSFFIVDYTIELSNKFIGDFENLIGIIPFFI